MPNFVKIPSQIKKWLIQALDSDCSVCMAAICYSSPISAVPTNEQLLCEERTAKKLRDLFTYIQTDGRTDGQTDTAKSIQLIMLIIYVHIL